MTGPLIACNFDEPEGEVQDYSGNERHWPLNNNAGRMASFRGNGLTKLGVGMPVVTSPVWPGVDLTQAWTIMFWQEDLGNQVWWVRLFNAGEDSGSGILHIGGTLRARVRRTSGNTEAAFAPPADGLPHHYCATYDGVNTRLYIDAVLRATSAIALAPALDVDRIDLAEHSLNEFWMDDFRIFDRAVDPSEIGPLKDTPVSATPTIESRWQRGDGVGLVPHLLTGSGLVEME
jgi:hypothetical protein